MTNFKLIPVKTETQQTLKRLCNSEGRTYSAMINTLIDYYSEVKEK